MDANAELKDKLLKTLNNHLNQHSNNHILIRYLLNMSGLLNSKGASLIVELVKDGYLDYHPTTNDNVMITKLGRRAAEIGYSIINNEVNDESNLHNQLDKDTKIYNYENSKFAYNTRYLVYISLALSAAAVLISYFKG